VARVTAAVWDDFSGLPHIRLMWDIAAVLDPSIARPFFRPLGAPNEMKTLWRELGLLDVEQTSLLIRMQFSCFDDYWSPFTTGEGPQGQFVAKSVRRCPIDPHRTYAASLYRQSA
jgi:hypothetical protein